MDFASRFLGGYGQGRQDKLASEQRAKIERTNALLGQAYADPMQQQAALAQVAALDPNAAFQAESNFASRDDRINKGRANLARAYLAMPEQGRQRFKQQFGQDFQRLWLDPNAPDFDQIATGYAQMGMAGAELPSEIRTLQMLQANPELLAVNDRFRGQKSFKEVTNPDGSVSYIALDNRTGTGSAAPIGAMGQQPRPQAPASGSPNMDALAQAANQMIAAGIPSEQVDAIIMQAAQRTQGVQVQPPGMTPAGGPSVAPQAAPAPSRGLPSIMDIGGGEPGFRPQGLGQTDRDRAGAAAQQAAMVEQAKIAAQQAAAPRQAALDAEREAAITAAREQATAAGRQQVDQRSKNASFAQYTAARDDLLGALEQTATGPIAGRLPAMTGNQQIAEGAQARMAPILKGLFRTAGEGTFTDKDQELLMAMVPSRTDLPEAMRAKIAGIDAIVQAKLQQSQQAAPRQDAPPVEGARKAPDGNWYVQQNGQYFKVEP